MRRLFATIVLGSLATLACGSNESDVPAASAPTNFTSGLPANSAMNSLAPADAERFCATIQQWSTNSPFQSQAIELRCRVSGVAAVAGPSVLGGLGVSSSDMPPPVTAGSEPAACKVAYDSCKAQPAQADAALASLDGDCTVAPDCDATVAEFETCINSLNGRLDGVTKNVPVCDSITSKSAADALMMLLTFYSQMTAGDCAPVATKCASMNPLGTLTMTPPPN